MYCCCDVWLWCVVVVRLSRCVVGAFAGLCVCVSVCLCSCVRLRVPVYLCGVVLLCWCVVLLRYFAVSIGVRLRCRAGVAELLSCWRVAVLLC